MLNKQVKYQGKAFISNWIFKVVAISWNTGKYELRGFSLRQLHIITIILTYISFRGRFYSFALVAMFGPKQ